MLQSMRSAAKWIWWFVFIAFVGGFLGYALFGADIEDGAVQMGGIFGSIIGSGTPAGCAMRYRCHAILASATEVGTDCFGL